MELVMLMEDADAAVCPYYVVEFGVAAIGMTLRHTTTSTGECRVLVGELRCDSVGRPMTALACGRITVGDLVLAVNDASLVTCSDMEAVGDVFRRARRPARVLFQKAHTISDF